MKVSAIVLSAMLGFSLNAFAQAQPKVSEKPKTAQAHKNGEMKSKKPKTKRNTIDSVLNVKPSRKHNPDYCPACGMG